jgi:hypothetical protein
VNVRASWAVLAVTSFMFLTGYTGCDQRPSVTYHPLYLPIEITLEPNGDIVLSAVPEIATSIGTFSASEPLAKYKSSQHGTLLAIRRPVHGVLKEDLIKVNSAARMKFLLDGSYGLSSQGNAAILNLHAGVTGIRIEKLPPRPSAARFSAKQVSTLPTPAAAPSTTPTTLSVPDVTCSAPQGDGSLTCSATMAAPGTYTFHWFDNGSLIGTGNPWNTILTPGHHLITTTATDTNGNSATSTAIPTTVGDSGTVSAIASCGTASTDGTVTCTATATGGTSDFTFQWSDSGSPLGTGNPLTVSLAPGGHAITVTATDSSGISATSAIATVSVPAAEGPIP